MVNTSKFETRDCDSIIEYIEFNNGQNQKPWKKIAGFISNTHLGDETTLGDIKKGYEILKEASIKTNIPIEAISVDEKFKADFKDDLYDNKPVRYLTRLMPKALW